MKISVAMCTFNGGRFLPMQLESIAVQERLPQELVVCDDGSSDGSLEVVTEFARRAPFPVRVFRNDKTLGSTKNFEQAIQLCAGDFIALCDQDDVWLGNKLARLSRVLEEDASLGGVFSDAELIDSNSNPTGKRLWRLHHFGIERPEEFDRDTAISLLLKHDVVTGATLMIRSSVRTLLTPISELWVHDGWIAWILVLYSRLSFVSEALVQYRIHANQQLGVGHEKWRDKVRHWGRENRRKLETMAKQYEALRDRLPALPGEDIESSIQMMNNKIAFLRKRSRLPQGFVPRTFSVLRSVRAYRCYARGLSSIRGDLFPSPVRGSGEWAG